MNQMVLCFCWENIFRSYLKNYKIKQIKSLLILFLVGGGQGEENVRKRLMFVSNDFIIIFLLSLSSRVNSKDMS